MSYISRGSDEKVIQAMEVREGLINNLIGVYVFRDKYAPLVAR